MTLAEALLPALSAMSAPNAIATVTRLFTTLTTLLKASFEFDEDMDLCDLDTRRRAGDVGLAAICAVYRAHEHNEGLRALRVEA